MWYPDSNSAQAWRRAKADKLGKGLAPVALHPVTDGRRDPFVCLRAAFRVLFQISDGR